MSPAPDDHFIASPDRRVALSAIGRASGSCPGVINASAYFDSWQSIASTRRCQSLRHTPFGSS